MNESFVSISNIPVKEIQNDHGGQGPISFRRLLRADAFMSPIDFVDFTVIPPKSEIGFHDHFNNEEIYMIVQGTPLVCLQEKRERLELGSVAIVRSGEGHGLINDTDEDVAIFVIQVRHSIGG